MLRPNGFSITLHRELAESELRSNVQVLARSESHILLSESIFHGIAMVYASLSSIFILKRKVLIPQNDSRCGFESTYTRNLIDFIEELKPTLFFSRLNPCFNGLFQAHSKGAEFDEQYVGCGNLNGQIVPMS